jgi:thiol-disulfide isomerase/thioredoxin
MTRRALTLAWLLVGCDDGPAPKTQAPPSRVVAVQAAPQRSDASDLCDVQPDGAVEFTLPELASPAPPARSGTWRWINVWATWCPPCVEELPLIMRFSKELNAQGVPVDLSLLSVDTDEDTVQKFAAAHAEAKESLRIKDLAALESWLGKIGLDGGATLPIQVFVDPQGKVRCARTGAVGESDLPAIKSLLKSAR